MKHYTRKTSLLKTCRHLLTLIYSLLCSFVRFHHATLLSTGPACPAGGSQTSPQYELHSTCREQENHHQHQHWIHHIWHFGGGKEIALSQANFPYENYIKEEISRNVASFTGWKGPSPDNIHLADYGKCYSVKVDYGCDGLYPSLQYLTWSVK